MFLVRAPRRSSGLERPSLVREVRGSNPARADFFFSSRRRKINFARPITRAQTNRSDGWALEYNARARV